MWGTIVNPKTGRKVSVTGTIGKRIIRKYINQLNGGVQFISDEKILKIEVDGREKRRGVRCEVNELKG